MIPTIGRIVLYTLTEDDAASINSRRRDAEENTFGRANKFGAQLHVGNPVRAGQIFPMIVTLTDIAESKDNSVNGQVFLDGSDTHWVSALQGDGPGKWKWPEIHKDDSPPQAKAAPVVHKEEKPSVKHEPVIHKKGR